MTGAMPILSAAGAAVLVAAAVLAWVAIVQRRRIEREAGVATLANMKWRESLGLLMQSLATQGYREESGDREPGDGGSLHLLRRDDETCLLAYKPGTAYRLGEASIRDFINEMRLRGSDRGILVTLGHVEGFARDSARLQGIELIDGDALWERIHPHLSEPLQQAIHRQAGMRIRRGLPWALASGALAGVLAYAMVPTAVTESIATTAEDDNHQARPVQAGADPSTASPEVAATALQEAARLDPEALAERRASAAGEVRQLERVRSAVWLARSTLSISLASTHDGDRDVIDEACRILLQFEELRYSRLQLEPPPGSTGTVRWRQCQ